MILGRVYVSGAFVGHVPVHVLSEAMESFDGDFRVISTSPSALDFFLDAAAASSPGGIHVLESLWTDSRSTMPSILFDPPARSRWNDWPSTAFGSQPH